MYKHISNKYAGKECEIYTLDGIKSGRIRQGVDNAIIAALDGSINMPVNWPTVERKMESDKLFYAC